MHGDAALLDATAWARQAGLPRFVDDFIRKVLCERPEDLLDFMYQYAAGKLPPKGAARAPAAAANESPPPHDGARQPAENGLLPPAGKPAQRSPLVSPAPSPLACSGAPHSGVRFTTTAPDGGDAGVAVGQLSEALTNLLAAVQRQHSASARALDMLQSYFSRVCDASLEVARKVEDKGVRAMPRRALVDVLVKAATTLEKKKAFNALSGKVATMFASSAATHAKSSAKELLAAVAAAAPSKFDATDQVQGRSGAHSDDEAEDDGAAPQRIPYYARSYHPRKDPLTVVHEFGGWHDPKGMLWPKHAINRLLRNCTLMIEQHSLGEPREVVVPLFAYSTFMFQSTCWGVWVPAFGGGKWVAVNPKGPWEACYRSMSEGGTVMDLQGAGESLDNVVKAAQKAQGDVDEQEALVFPDSVEVVLRDGQPLGEGPAEQPYWDGTTIFRGENQQTGQLARSMSAWSTGSGGGGGSESAFSGAFDKEQFVYLARLAPPESLIGTSLFPLSDCVCWLPMPEAMMAGDEGSADCFTLKKGGSMVQRVRKQVPPDELGTPPGTPPEPEMQTLYRYPPPGVLEYIFSRRSDEELFRSSADGDLFRVKHASTATEELVAMCFQQKNQQQYSPEIHQALRRRLETSDAMLGDVETRVLRQVVLLKTGDDCGLSAAPPISPLAQSQPAAAVRPSPLSIAHSLDLQELTWRGQPWFISFSGKPFGVASSQFGCQPWFRLRVAFEDQPYWHLNTAMRNLSFGKTSTILEINQVGGKGPRLTRKKGHPAVAVGRFLAHNSGDAYGELTAAQGSPAEPWRVCFMKGWEGKQVYAALCDALEEQWRQSPEGAAADPAERAPYECTARAADESQAAWRVTGPQQKGSALPATIPLADSWIDIGTWLLWQVRPLLWQIATAMSTLRPVVGGYRCAPTVNLKLYRGLQNVTLSPKVYARGKVVLWGQFSSSSKDQGVAQSFAGGPKASVFTLEGSSCRLIAPWSRFGREEEWLFPLNTLWQVTALLTEEQRQILDKSDTQLYEMREIITDVELSLLQVRSVLGKAPTAAAAGIIFQAEHGLKSGGGFLNLTLKRTDEGSTPVQWSCGTKVSYDGSGRCPISTSTQFVACDPDAAELLAKYLARGRNVQDKGMSAACVDQVCEGKFSNDTPVGKKVLGALGKILGIARPDAAELTKQSASAIEIKVMNASDLWEVLLTVRRQSKRQGIAIRDEGAEILAKIIRRGVPLAHIEIGNNDVQLRGVTALLNALRRNPKVMQLKVGDGSVLSECEPLQARPLVEIGSTLPPLSFEEVVQAINIRCLQHQGRILFDRLEAFGPGWPAAAAAALHDLRSLDIDFAGLFRWDEENFCSLTETFIVRLALACKAHRPLAPRFPKMHGALVAASIGAPARVVELLLDLGADIAETGDWGETAYIKARRRLLPGGFAPIPHHILERLCTPQVVVNVKPRATGPDAELWRLRNIGLIAMRVWDDKVAAGRNVVDELVLNLDYPKPCSSEQRLDILATLAMKVIRSASVSRGSLGKIPVDRAKVSVLCYIVTCCSKEQLNRMIAEVYNERVARSTGRRADPAELRNEDIASGLRAATRTLHNPQAWGSAADLSAMRERLGQWALLWALLNCTLCCSAEGSKEAVMRTTFTSVPAPAFHGYLSLRKGDPCTMPNPHVWQQEPAPPVTTRRFTARKSIDIAKIRDDEADGEGAPPCTAVTFCMSGKWRGEDVAALLPDSPEEERMMIPGLASYLVADQHFEVATSSLRVSLVSLGSLFNSDPELIAWKKRVLTRAEWAETQLELGKDRAGGTELSSVVSEEEIVRWTIKMDEHWSRTSTDFQAAHRRLLDIGHERGMRHRVVDRRADGDEALVVTSHWARHSSREGVERLAAAAVGALRPCTHIGCNDTVCCPGGAQREWAVGRLSREAAFPYTKRPAAALLHQLGRTLEGRQARWTDLRAVQLEIAVLDQGEYSKGIEVSAPSIEEYHAQCKALGRVDADAVALGLPEGPDGASAAQLYGGAAFRITMGEVQQLVRSTKLTVLPDRTPLLFVLALIRRFTFHEEHADCMRLARHLPLSAILDEGQWAAEQEGLLRALQRRLEEAKDRADPAPQGGESAEAAALRAAYFRDVAQGVAADLQLLQEQPARLQRTRDMLRRFEGQARSAPEWWDCQSTREVGAAVAKSVAELATEICISQRGYFLTRSSKGGQNQLCEKALAPVVFLATSGIDFTDPFTAASEGGRYFMGDADALPHPTWSGFKTNAEQALHQRVRKIWETVFTAARTQDVRNLAAKMLGGTATLGSITHAGLRRTVQETYLEALFELLCVEDWGFENFFLTTESAEHTQLADEVLQRGLRADGPFNSPGDGLFLRCNVVLHEKCPKQLCQELAAGGMAPGYLVPCDPLSTMFGILGARWETGRGPGWTAEADLAATSTAVLGHLGVSGTAVGLDDVVLQLANGNKLRVARLDGLAAHGVVCAVEDAAQGTTTYHGPFRCIRRDADLADISFFNEARRKSVAAPVEAGKHSWELDRVKPKVLQPLLSRLVRLARRAKVQCVPDDLGTETGDADGDEDDPVDAGCFAWIRAAGRMASLITALQEVEKFANLSEVRHIHLQDHGPQAEQGDGDFPSAGEKWHVLEFASPESAEDVVEGLSKQPGCEVGAYGVPGTPAASPRHADHGG
eukprot:TRINITY_DN30671_c0_g1_i1.p1 TRINITY_DN30671_c0_g1~~TRINITY_DN30671_c0_g1_i1.p1  ORF type:complete len:2687 (+),score=782.45 TRINITY_DN30671_c0_g1_i1:64-8061(+)